MCAALQIERWLRRCGAGNKKGRQLVRTALKQASGMGLNVMRIFAHTTDPNFVLQTAPGEYNEKVPGQPHPPPRLSQPAAPYLCRNAGVCCRPWSHRQVVRVRQTPSCMGSLMHRCWG